MRFVAASLLVLLVGCGGAGIDGAAPRVYGGADEMVTEARLGIPEISADDLRGKIDNEDMFFLIDVRGWDEADSGAIDGSFLLPRGVLEFRIADEDYWDSEGMFVPEKGEELILYSNRGKRSALAAEALIKLGYGNVKSLAGGWVVWAYGPDALEIEEAKPEEGGCG
jgi:rhodanese-related sulfurtransferase